MKKSKILVTGSAGFIFSYFVRHVLRTTKEYNLVSVDKVTRDKGLKTIYINPSHNFYLADVADHHIINRIFEKERPDYVVHGAAESHVDDSIAGAVPFIHSNVMGTQVITDACVKYGVKKLVYISTDEVYGQLAATDKPWKEDSNLNPRNPYSASKLSGELIVKAAGQTHGLNYNITRSCNNFGPRQSTKNLVPKIIKNIINKEDVPIYGQGSQIREWIHVEDNCEAILKILKAAPSNETYNISTGYEFSNLEMFNEICNIMEDGHQLIKFVKDREGHDFRYAIDSSKLRELGWTPSFRFKEALKQVIFWYKGNQWYLE